MGLSVIGAGLPRTATWSQKLALEMLGFGPCYHMSEALEHPEHWPLWEAAAAGAFSDWDAIFRDWGSTTDAPGCHFYKELMAYYPEAKVVLSVRDPERWFASTQNTILSGAVAGFHGARGSLAMVEAVGWGTDPRLHDKAFMLDRYHRHNEEVRRAVPADRLLVYDVSQGWAPLCAFLGVRVPEEPFPTVNSTEDFKAMITARQADGGGIVDTHRAS
jgi:hypothetical protein